jgi:hypothetical protein
MKAIRFNKSIYSLKAIKTTIRVYKDYADINVTEEGDNIVITFSNCKYETNQTMHEFENYLVGMENSLL